MVDGGQLLAGEFCIGGSFKPTDARDRVIVLASWIFTAHPSSWTRSPCGILKQRRGLVPGKCGAIFEERLFPVLLLAISALRQKLLVLPIRYLESIDPEITDGNWWQVIESIGESGEPDRRAFRGGRLNIHVDHFRRPLAFLDQLGSNGGNRDVILAKKEC